MGTDAPAVKSACLPLCDKMVACAAALRSKSLPVNVRIVRARAARITRTYGPILTSNEALPRNHTAVLVVDDHEQVRKLVVRILEGAGLTVIAADNGIAAIEHIEQPNHGIGCVVQDLSMPRMPGEEVIRRLNEIAPDLPIVAFSAQDEESAADRLQELNIAGYVQKPFEIDAMVEMLLRLTASPSTGMRAGKS